MLTERQRRVGELLQAEISDILLREVRDPGIHGLVTITGVEVSVDLAHARVYASIYGDAAAVADTMAALRRASPFIRALLLRRLDIKRVPELVFYLDETPARADRIERLIRELHPGQAGEAEAGEAGEADENAEPVHIEVLGPEDQPAEQDQEQSAAAVEPEDQADDEITGQPDELAAPGDDQPSA